VGCTSAPNSANDDTQAIFALGSGATWSAVQTIWAGATFFSEAKRVYYRRIAKQDSTILEQEEIF